MIEIKINDKNFKKKFIKVQWSGGIYGTSRKLNIEFVKGENIDVALGDKIEFKLSNTETLFKGKVFSLEREAENKNVILTAYDASIYLNKNFFVKNYYNKVPSEIVKEICSELKLEVGRLPQDKVKCTFPAIDKSGYEILLTAYTIQHNKDKGIYSINCDNGKIEVVDQGVLIEDLELDSYNDLRRVLYSESIENMINQMIVYKTDKGKTQIIDKVANEEDKNKYGLFQNVVEYTEDMNNIFNARDMLKGKESFANIIANGNIDLISGFSIAVKDHNTGLIGKFLIKNDNHIFIDGDYYTTLELVFDNVMDKIELEKLEKKKKKTKAKKEGMPWDDIELKDEVPWE